MADSLAGPLLRVENLVRSFGGIKATDNLSLDVLPGELHAIIGPNGAGKTTLISQLTGQLMPNSGAVHFAGRDVTRLPSYQRSRLGRLLRASREDPAAAQAVGVGVHAQRLWAFTLSGALCGLAGGLLVHMLGSITTEQVYLELTFLTLAMLVVGGITSLWGAVVGALAVSGLDSLLGNAEDGIGVGFTLDLPEGSRLVILGGLMALMLILRPSGLTGGRELRLSRRRPA